MSEELSMEEVLNLNKVRNRYSKKEIEDLIIDYLNNSKMFSYLFRGKIFKYL